MTDTGCTCGPGPIGGQGWRADCPSHNVRALLTPQPFDPAALPDKLAALGLTLAEDGIDIDPVTLPGCTCPYYAGDDDDCPLHGEQARYQEWMNRP